MKPLPVDRQSQLPFEEDLGTASVKRASDGAALGRGFYVQACKNEGRQR